MVCHRKSCALASEQGWLCYCSIYLTINVDTGAAKFNLLTVISKDQRSFKRINSLARSTGDMSGLIRKGEDIEDLFARIALASIVRCNLTRIGLGLDCWTLN